tara:strand:- start:23 stop:190 length:168 start_codon:yes stop_codon:yes gene_type:complete
LTKDTNFLNFITKMFYENCLERSLYGEEEYPNADAYYKKNEKFLKQEYNKLTGEK